MKTRNELYSAILEDLSARTSWDARQKVWYEMRHHGLRRKRKPWPGAADLHYPLADSIINKLKPFYFQQLYAGDLVAQFVPWRSQAARLTNEAMMWFDYQVRQRSNLETEIQTAIDTMLMSGLCLVKTTWDVERQRLRFDAVHPIYIIVPANTQNIQQAARLVHVMPMSVDDYRARREYNQDNAFVRRITGSSGNGESKFAWAEIKNIREGLTSGSRENEIIVWEVYERQDERWIVHTFSPLSPQEDIRPRMELAYAHGRLPFTPFVTEIKDKGFYSARGIPEAVAPFEASLCKLWNEKHDAMTIYNRPVFRSEHEMPNAINLKFQPGQILPFGVNPLPMPSPPLSFDQEMEHIRLVAENLIAMPDFGLGSSQRQRSARTATEVQALTGLHSQNIDMRARVFRISLGELLQQSWALLKQYALEDLMYCHGEAVGTATLEALENDYMIHPSGSADGANRALLLQKALQRMQLFAGNKHVNQQELIRSVLEIDDPRLVRRLMRPDTGEAAVQVEEQAKECLLLEAGFKVEVRPEDDDQVHIRTLMQRLEMLGAIGKPVDSIARARLHTHLAEHARQLRRKNSAHALDPADSPGADIGGKQTN